MDENIIIGIIIGGSIIVLVTAFLILVIIVRYIQDAPRRNAEKALREGHITEGLKYFWHQNNFLRISQFINAELSLPDTSWWGRWWREDPQFRRLIAHNYHTLLTLMMRVEDKTNAAITAEMRDLTRYHTTRAAVYVFYSCQQLSYITRKGETRIKNNALRPSFIMMAERLRQLESTLIHTRSEMDKYALSPHHSDLQMHDIFKGLNAFAYTIQQHREIETDIVQEFLQ